MTVNAPNNGTGSVVRRCHMCGLAVLAGVFLWALVIFFASPATAEAATSATIGGDERALEAAGWLSYAQILTEWDTNEGVRQEYITRGQLAIMLARALELEDATVEYYDDVPRSMDCFGAVGALHEVELITGPTATTFAPHETISRRWAVLWIMETLEYHASRQGSTDGPYRMSYFESTSDWLGGFRDRPMLGDSCERAVANACRLGIVEATSDGWFYPNLPLSWGDAAIMLERAFVRSADIRSTHPDTRKASSEYPQLRRNSRGPLVWYLQYKLTELKYFPGEIDGIFMNHTRDAVLAFQKVERLKRTGVVTDGVFQRLFTAQTPTPKLTDAGTRVEIDLTRQVLFMITDNEVWKIVHISTGRLGTRTGHFSIQTKHRGNVECVTVTGIMYYPSYVVSRTAIHGYPSVPTYPASHGCIRVPMWMAEQLWHETPTGMTVDIYRN